MLLDGNANEYSKATIAPKSRSCMDMSTDKDSPKLHQLHAWQCHKFLSWSNNMSADGRVPMWCACRRGGINLYLAIT